MLLEERAVVSVAAVPFAVMLASPTGTTKWTTARSGRCSSSMIACGEEFERRLLAGRRYPFTNVCQRPARDPQGDAPPLSLRCRRRLPSASPPTASWLPAIASSATRPARWGNVARSTARSRTPGWPSATSTPRSPAARAGRANLCGGGCHHEVLARAGRRATTSAAGLHYCIGAYCCACSMPGRNGSERRDGRRRRHRGRRPAGSTLALVWLVSVTPLRWSSGARGTRRRRRVTPSWHLATLRSPRHP